MKTWNSFEVETEEEVDLDSLLSEGKNVVLFNDDVHTFDFVIDALIKVCDHDPIQAEQCTHLIHFKGKCAVKRGLEEDLEPICTALLDRGLSAEIH